MKDYKYEKVEGMTVGMVIDAMVEGVSFHVKYGEEDHAELFPEDYDCLTIKTFIDQRELYRKIEAPWWEKHVGSLVMFRDNQFCSWVPAFLYDYYEEHDCYITTLGYLFDQMRPLTAAEKASIITEG